MKRAMFVFLLTILLVNFAVAVDPPETGIGVEDKEAVEGAIDKIPIDPSTGKIDFNNTISKTKAEERIEKINEYVGPITLFIFNSELTLSWIFVFSLIMWLLLIELILAPVSEVFGFNVWGSLLFSGIIATLSMRSFGNNIVMWMDSLFEAWWAGIFVVIIMSFIWVIYEVIMRAAGKKVKAGKEAAAKDRTRRDREILHADAKLVEEDLNSRSRRTK